MRIVWKDSKSTPVKKKGAIGKPSTKGIKIIGKLAENIK